MAATGVGALGGALYLAGRKSVVGLGKVTMYATLTFGAGLVAFAFTRHVALAVGVLVIVGAGFLGTAPIGSLLAGLMADRIGMAPTIAAGGFACLMSGAWLAARLPALRTIVRPIYVQRGVLQAVETVNAEP